MIMLWESLGQWSSQILKQLYVNIHLHNKSTAEASVRSLSLKGVFNTWVQCRNTLELMGFYISVSSYTKWSFKSFVLLPLMFIFSKSIRLNKSIIWIPTWKIITRIKCFKRNFSSRDSKKIMFAHSGLINNVSLLLEISFHFYLERVWLQWETGFREVEHSCYENEENNMLISFGKNVWLYCWQELTYILSKWQRVEVTGLSSSQSFNKVAYVMTCQWLSKHYWQSLEFLTC